MSIYCSYVGQEVNISRYGVGRGQIWLDDIDCNGTERHIANCSRNDWAIHNCAHYEDVAVFCHAKVSGKTVKIRRGNISPILAALLQNAA